MTLAEKYTLCAVALYIKLVTYKMFCKVQL